MDNERLSALLANGQLCITSDPEGRVRKREILFRRVSGGREFVFSFL